MGSPLWNQTKTLSAVFFNSFTQNMLLSIPTTVLLKSLLDSKYYDYISVATVSTLANLTTIGTVVGLIASSLSMKEFGRKITYRIFVLPGIIACLIVCFALDVTGLKIAVIFGGISSGGTINLGSIIIGEYSSPENRGLYIYLNNVAYHLGGLVVFIIIMFEHYKVIALLGLTFFLFTSVIVHQLPESPFVLSSKQQYQKSEAVFYWLRGETEESMKEIKEIIEKDRADNVVPKEILNFTRDVLEFCFRYTKRDFLKPFSLILVAILLREMSGTHYVVEYSELIVKRFRQSDTFEGGHPTIRGTILVGTAAMSSLVVKSVKGRRMLLVTGTLACISLALASVNFFIDSSVAVTVSLSLFVTYFALANLCCSSLYSILLCECVPFKHKSITSAVAGISAIIIRSVVKELFQLFFVKVDVGGTLLFFSFIMAMCLMNLYFYLPETKDRTLQEIEILFRFQDKK